ncbi:hypothetical protein BS78_04G173700 [Paspalum vaginatum]|nr:hypothetical protein BS78_04G173700 [Paspalum vaginatum]
MAPRSRLLDLERHDVLCFYGTYHHHGDGDNNSSVATSTHAIVFWPVFLLAALVLHIVAPLPHAAAVCAALYVAYCFFVLDRAAWARLRPSTAGAGPPAAVIEQKSYVRT